VETEAKGTFGRLAAQASPSVDRAEFSPELLRIQETPPRPLPRAVLSVALALLGAVLLWAVFGRLDVVAVAQGKLVPRTYVKIVQPSEAGIVREILVHEGERVEAGQILMSMDSTLATADLHSLVAEHQQTLIDLRRIDAELLGVTFERHADDPLDLFEAALKQYRANRVDLAAALAEERSAHERAKHELAASREVGEKLGKIVPLYREQDAMFAKLAEQGYVGKLAAAEKRRERIEKEEEHKTQASLIAREEAAVKQSEHRLAQIRSGYLKRLRDERAEVALRSERLAQELAKQEHRRSLLELRAPQTGVVKNLATHTVGTVTQPGTILMTLVPDNEALIAEVWLSNEDVGFVRDGQEVKLKLASFRFQKYGMIDGSVLYVAADAEEQNENGAGFPSLAYRTLVTLDSQHLHSDGISYKLVPGMQATAEIKLGRRTILEYLLSPVQRAFQEAGRER